MRTLLLTCSAVLLAALLAAPAAAASKRPVLSPEDSLLTACLERLGGVVPGSDTIVAWDTFRAHPQRTVELIVRDLRPVKRSLWLGAPNMVWRVRVLQRLTGLEWRATTRAKLTSDEWRALAPDSLRRIRFAGEVAAEGKTWTAPRDAQEAILLRWRQWWAIDTKKPELPVVKHDDDRTWWY